MKIKSESFEIKTSGWSLINIKRLMISINKYFPLSGSLFVKTPKFLQDKKAIINVQNNDNLCFLWSVLAFKKLQSNPNYRNLDRLCNQFFF
jgi:hypothetical protein